jgi:signal transduction histidine kinase
MAAVTLLLVAAFAFVALRSQQQSRVHAQEQFDAEATVTARLTTALFASASGSGEAQLAQAFGARTPTVASLDALVKQSKLRYAILIDANGHVIAASTGTAAAAQSSAPSSRPVRQALAGHSWLSDIEVVAGKPSMAWALPFSTTYGRRVLLEGMNTDVVSTFLGDTVGQGADGVGRKGFVVDGRDTVVASSARSLHVGDPAAPELVSSSSGTYSDGGQTYFTSSRIGGSDWRVVLTARTSDLYPALSGWRRYLPFAIIAAFGIAAALCVIFLRRVLVAGAALSRTNSELMNLNTTLEHKVAERTADLEERARELGRSNDELQQFASIASHDLQEPLRKIRMFGDRLVKRTADLEDETKSDIERIQGAALRMQRLIDDLLSFARVTSRQRAFESTDLRSVAAEVVADLEPRIVELDAEVEVEELPVLQADRVQMHQLMQNLVSNALKFHRPDVRPVVRISSRIVEGTPPRFAGEKVPGPRCEIVVADNGVGFDQQYAERIFSAFERLHSRADYDGTGIGLSIARKIAWRHGGDISATGEQGKGATFTVTLPVNNDHAANGG